MIVANSTPHLTPRMRGPQGRIQFRIGGGPQETERHLVNFDGELVDLAKADIKITAKLIDPRSKTLTIPAAGWKLKAKSLHEVIATWHPTGTEIIALGDYTLQVEMTVNGHHYDGGTHKIPCRENTSA